mmetsp:Transcript_66697/g.159466  ORF Transcript_66697/g.159466 Transcript_66697/m.159466 type:complete len:85 (+) Transcript_66697:227-481(+)
MASSDFGQTFLKPCCGHMTEMDARHLRQAPQGDHHDVCGMGTHATTVTESIVRMKASPRPEQMASTSVGLSLLMISSHIATMKL